MQEVAGVTPQQVLRELAEIAFALPGEEGGLPVKVADKLKALELLYRHLGLEGPAAGTVTIVDDVGPPAQAEEGGPAADGKA